MTSDAALLTFVCWKYVPRPGREKPSLLYTSEHVNRLVAQLKKKCSSPHRVVCITDDPVGLDCQHIDMPLVLPGNLRKLWVFSSEALNSLDMPARVVVTDLDVEIVRDIAPLFDLRAELQIWRRPPTGRINSSIYSFVPGGWRTGIWDNFQTSPVENRRIAQAWCRKRFNITKGVGSDQAWMDYCLHTMSLQSDTFEFANGVYKADMLNDIPEDARIIYFPGDLNPWMTEARQKWWWLQALQG